MKITFVAPGIGLSGGIRAIFEFANHLHTRGHEVTVVYPLIPAGSLAKWLHPRKLAGGALGIVTNLKQGPRIDWMSVKAALLRVPTLAPRYLPDADIVVATWWETAYYVNRYTPAKGEKFYLVQHYETWGGPETEVNKSYQLGLRNIVNSAWLKNILQDKLKANVEALITHAPDWEQFYPEPVDRQPSAIRVLMPYRREKWKGTEDGISAFEIARRKCPDIRLVMFGSNPSQAVPKYAEYYQRPDSDRLREIYNSCDIFLFPSRCEGFGMPPMEAMACKLAVVTTDVGAVPEYTISGETALISPPQSPELLAGNLVRLIEDGALRQRVAEAGHLHIKRFTWDRATDELEVVFRRVMEARA